MATILVVEDEHPQLFVNALKYMGYETLVALRGDTAVELAHEHRPDAIIMDLRLPGLNGVEAIRQIREFDVNVPIFAVTAYTDLHRRDEVLAAGANIYHPKPPDLAVLLDQIDKMLRGGK